MTTTTETNGTTTLNAKPTSEILWTARSKNPKTGDVPTAWIGETKEKTRLTCKKCPIRSSCYAYNGTTVLALGQVQKVNKTSPKRYKIESALSHRIVTSKIVRISAIGDAGHESVDANRLKLDLQEVLNEGLTPIGYTHYWKQPHNQWLRKFLRASCESEKLALLAIDLGWKPVILSKHPKKEVLERKLETEKFTNLVGKMCLYYTNDINCNSCKACNVSNSDIIVFPRL